MKRVLIKLLN